MGLHQADIYVLLFYLVCMVAIGVWSARKIKDSADFFMPRRFGKVFMIMFSFGTGTHSDQAVSVASKSFTNGLSGIWYQWLWLPVTPFYWLIAPVFRRFRAITTSDVFEARFSPSVAMLFAVVGVLNLAVNIGIMLKGSSEVISASTGEVVSANLAIVIMTVIFVIYGVAGGLGAAILTDFIQGVLTIVFSFLLLPLILKAVGGLAGLRGSIADGQMFSLVALLYSGDCFQCSGGYRDSAAYDGQLCRRQNGDGGTRRLYGGYAYQASVYYSVVYDGAGGGGILCGQKHRAGQSLRGSCG
jgi:Na+/proline symporter